MPPVEKTGGRCPPASPPHYTPVTSGVKKATGAGGTVYSKPTPGYKLHVFGKKQDIAPGDGETICLPPMAVRLATDLRPPADGSAIRTWLSCRQPACL